MQIFTRRAEQGIAECEHALALDRNLAHAHSPIGIGKVLIGRAEETEPHIAEALQLSPRDTMAYVWMSIVGIALSTTVLHRRLMKVAVGQPRSIPSFRPAVSTTSIRTHGSPTFCLGSPTILPNASAN